MTKIIYDDRVLVKGAVTSSLDSLANELSNDPLIKSKVYGMLTERESKQKDSVKKMLFYDLQELYIKASLSSPEEAYELFKEKLGELTAKHLFYILAENYPKDSVNHINSMIQTDKNIVLLTKMPLLFFNMVHKKEKNHEFETAIEKEKLKVLTPYNFYHKYFPIKEKFEITPDSIDSALFLQASKEFQEEKSSTLYISSNLRDVLLMKETIKEDSEDTRMVKHIGSNHPPRCKSLDGCFMDLLELESYANNGMKG
ncbi:MAG TPA: hypothetical protein VJJ23_03875 [Candidatus Nanoarchaeia archaeon]|nr:hypothetical protein [Candidatus Nanoarchaeia archaeon]